MCYLKFLLSFRIQIVAFRFVSYFPYVSMVYINDMLFIDGIFVGRIEIIFYYFYDRLYFVILIMKLVKNCF